MLSPSFLLGLWLVLTVSKHLWETVLDVLNLTHERAQPPDELGDRFDPATHARMTAYQRARGILRFPSRWSRVGVTLAIVAGGGLGWLHTVLGGLVASPYLHGLVLLGLLSVASAMVDLPFGLYRVFGIERRFGFNTMTWRTLVADLAKGSVLGVVIGVPLLLGLFVLVDRGGELWWLFAFALIAGFQLVVSALYPTLIAPIFNRFKPLPPSSLRDRLEALAARLGFRMRDLQVMDGSRRSRHSNAYFAGLGRAKRVVLFDTLVEQLDEGQLAAVLAHEIGHQKRRHVAKRLVVSTLFTLSAFWVLGRVLHYDPLYQAFGFAGSGDGTAALLIVVQLALPAALFVFNPLLSAWSRRQEFDADRFASQAMGGHVEMTGALLRLARDNLSDTAPHPWYSSYHYSHPPLVERLNALRRHAGARSGEPSGSYCCIAAR